jgi:hypothetical protein
LLITHKPPDSQSEDQSHYDIALRCRFRLWLHFESNVVHIQRSGKNVMRCDGMRQINWGQKSHRKSRQITEISKIPEIPSIFQKMHFLIFAKCRWLCIWAVPALPIFESSDNVCRSVWPIVTNEDRQPWIMNDDHKYSLKRSLPSTITSIA